MSFDADIHAYPYWKGSSADRCDRLDTTLLPLYKNSRKAYLSLIRAAAIQLGPYWPHDKPDTNQRLSPPRH